MKVLKIKIGDKIIQEKIRYRDNFIIRTKNYEAGIINGKIVIDEEGFEGACIVNSNPIKYLFRKRG